MKRTISEKHINEVKELLLENKEKIESALSNLANEHESLSNMDLNDEGDFAAASRDYNTDVHIKKQQERELAMINHSLAKIEKGVFTGQCEMCDAEIGIQRLRVKPHAKYCIDCRNYIDKNGDK